MAKILKLFLIICFVFVVLQVGWGLSDAEDAETAEDVSLRAIVKLRKQLLKNYDRKSRPVIRHRNTTIVKFDLTPIHITEVDESRSTFAADTWMKMTWTDEHLAWNSDDFDGLNLLHFADDELWHPDVAVYNAQGSLIDPLKKTFFLVYPTGIVMWVPPASLRLLCPMSDYTDYPQDTHQCTAKIGSWTTSGELIDFQLRTSEENTSLELSDFHDINPNWKLTNYQSYRLVTKYACCEEPYITVNFVFTIQRRGTTTQMACRLLRTSAHVLLLCMFWIGVDSLLTKLIPGFLGLFFYMTTIAVTAWSTPSPVIAKVSFSPLYSEIYAALGAIIVEMVVVNVAAIRNFHAPSFLNWMPSDIWKTVFCLWDSVSSKSTTYDRVTMATATMADDSVHLETESVRVKNEFASIATILDRFAFLIFIVVFLFTGSYF